MPDAVGAHGGIAARCHRGRPPATPGAIEIDLGDGLPCAFAALRRLLGALEREAPAAVARAAARHAIEWDALATGSASSAAMRAVAGAPSERRLRRGSEQVFRVLQAASDAVVEAVADLGRTLVLRRCGAADLVSLRGLMRAVERSRCAGIEGLLVCAEWDAATPAGLAGHRRLRALDAVRERMRAPLEEDGSGSAPAGGGAAFDSAEGCHLRALADAGRPPAERVAAALLAVRACFLSTNHEGSLLAAERALRLLRDEPAVDTGEIARAFAEMDDGLGTGDVEIDAGSAASSLRDLEALLWRSVGVVHAFTGDVEAGRTAFERGLAAEPSPLARANLHRCLGLLLAAREDGVAELERGLALVDGEKAPEAAVAEGWLRGALAGAWLARRRVRDAYQQLTRALQRVGDRQDAAAADLRLQLLMDVSGLQEAAGRPADAVRVWHRLLELSPDWGERFLERYAYREGGLRLAAGDEAGLVCCRRALRSATAIGDAFHGAAIAAEVGGHHLAAGRGDEALRWFEEAAVLARRTGDPYRLGQAAAGAALAGGAAGLGPAAALLEAAITHAEPARTLAGAIAAGDRQAVAAALPRPGTVLDRPIDLVDV